MRKAVISLVAIGLGTLALVPAGPTPAAGASGPLRMTVGTLGAVGSLDPRRGTSDIAREVWNLQYPTLTSLDPKTLDPAPGIAASWSPAPGGNGWIYKLRPGLRWSDGQQVTADDVVYSLVLPGITRATNAMRRLAAVDVRALSDRTVEVTFTTRNPPGPGLLLNVVPKHVFERTADLDANLAQLGVSDGTWHVVTKASDSVELQATAPTGGPTLFQIDFRTFRSDTALIDALAHKQVDVVSGLPAADLGRLEALDQVTVNHSSDGSQFVLRDSLADVEVRRAVSLAVDRGQLVTDVAHGVGTPEVVPLIARGATWALDPATVESLTTSLDAQPDRARQLMAGTPPLDAKVVVAAQQSGTTGARVVDFVRRSLHAVGIETMTGPEGLRAGRQPDLLVDFDPVVGDNGPDGLYALECPACGGLGSVRRYLLPTDFTAQVAAAHDALRNLTASAEVVGLFEPDTLQAFRSDNVTGFLRDPEIRSLVVFGPTVAQYGQLTTALPPPGERLSNTAYSVGAVIVLVCCLAAFLVAAWVRRRFVLLPRRALEGES